MNLYEKLTLLQNELVVPKGRNNSFGKYRYRSAEDILDKVKPLLKKHRLTQVVSDSVETVNGWYYVKSTVTVIDMDKPEDSVSASGFAREEELKKGMDTSQVTGSTSSYARKYALNGMYAIDESEGDPDALNNGQNQGDNLSGKIKGEAVKSSEIEALYKLAERKGFDRATVAKHCTAKYGIAVAEIDKEQYKAMHDGYGKLPDMFAGTPFEG